MNQPEDEDEPTYAESLVGRELNGWLVERRLQNDEFSGGYNSVSYVVSRGSETAFLKVYDVQDSLRRGQSDPDFNAALEIYKLTQKYMFERDLLNVCERMDRVVNIIDSGQTYVDASDPASLVLFIVCELADCDVRKALGAIDRHDVSWRLNTLHQVATGLGQLHGGQIAHNDFKQANILVTKEGRKIGDLGSGTRRGILGPNDGPSHPGDRRYAAPEVIYDFRDPDWVRRHIPGDLFALGSVAAFLFTGLSMQSLMMHKHLSPVHREVEFYGGSWTGTFSEVIPYLIDSYAKSLAEISNALPAPEGRYDYRSDMMELIKCLTHPNPEERGLRGADGLSTLALGRIVTKLDAMANLARVRNQRAAQ